MRNFLFLLLLSVMACGPSKNESANSEPKELTEAEMKEEVMKVHDEVMPKMSDLRKTSQQLLKLADSVGVSDSLMAAKYRKLSDELTLANESMMDWMRKFDPDYVGDKEKVKAYMEAQLESIQKVRSDMLNSLEEGEKALGE